MGQYLDVGHLHFLVVIMQCGGCVVMVEVGLKWLVHLPVSHWKYRVFFSYWYPPKKLKYGKPRLGESTLT